MLFNYGNISYCGWKWTDLSELSIVTDVLVVRLDYINLLMLTDNSKGSLYRIQFQTQYIWWPVRFLNRNHEFYFSLLIFILSYDNNNKHAGMSED